MEIKDLIQFVSKHYKISITDIEKMKPTEFIEYLKPFMDSDNEPLTTNVEVQTPILLNIKPDKKWWMFWK